MGYGLGTALQARGLRVRYPRGSLRFFIDFDIDIGRTMTLGSAEPLTEMSTKDLPWGVKAASAYGWRSCHLRVPIVWKSWESNGRQLNVFISYEMEWSERWGTESQKTESQTFCVTINCKVDVTFYGGEYSWCGLPGCANAMWVPTILRNLLVPSVYFCETLFPIHRTTRWRHI